jgi:adenosylmethionine-8-amino-7-oxononanoate aminotransferase
VGLDLTFPAFPEVIMEEGPNSIAAMINETVTGTNGVLVPPAGLLEGLREICDKYGILMIADEVMCGFGRTGKMMGGSDSAS